MSLIHKGNKIASNAVTGDTLPIGTIVNYDGTVIPDGYEEVTDYLPIYSATEQKVGTWTNGKPIYRKVINFGALPNTNSKTVNHNISNFGYLVSLKGTATDGTNYFTLPRVHSNSTLCIVLEANTTQILINTAYNFSSYSAYVTIEYTKTTD